MSIVLASKMAYLNILECHPIRWSPLQNWALNQRGTLNVDDWKELVVMMTNEFIDFLTVGSHEGYQGYLAPSINEHGITFPNFSRKMLEFAGVFAELRTFFAPQMWFRSSQKPIFSSTFLGILNPFAISDNYPRSSPSTKIEESPSNPCLKTISNNFSGSKDSFSRRSFRNLVSPYEIRLVRKKWWSLLYPIVFGLWISVKHHILYYCAPVHIRYTYIRGVHPVCCMYVFHFRCNYGDNGRVAS